MPSVKNLDDLFLHTLCRVYEAERRLTTALPRMADAAEAPALKEAFQGHLQETATHVARLEQVFEMVECAPIADIDDGLRGIVQSSDEIMRLSEGPFVKDAALIAAAQEAEHYEIAVYGTLRTWAHVLHRPDVAQLLEQTLVEEKQADQKLTDIAEALNTRAAA